MIALFIASACVIAGTALIYFVVSGKRSGKKGDSETWEKLWMSRLD